MRFFIALEIPESSKEQLEDVQIKLQKIIPNFRPSFKEKLHLTIAFVGEREDSLEEALVEVITNSVRMIPAFSVTPAYIDGFPSLHKARVLWTGVKGDIDKLYIIRERIKDGLKSLHLETDERRFIPHIALGKASNLDLQSNQELEIERIEQQKFAPIPVTSIKLFESVPNQGFHKHNTLAEIKLG